MKTEEYAAMYAVEDTHWWYTGMRRLAAALLRPRLRARIGKLDILDAGCGTGGNSAFLQQYGRVWGIDAVSDALQFARRRPGLSLAQASVDRLPFPDGSFDLVISNDVLCHLFVSDDQKAVAEFARVLRPGGVLYLQLPAFDRLRSHHDAAVFTKHRYTRDELRQMLTAGGFERGRVTYANALLFPLAAAWRAVHKLGSPEEAERSDVRPVQPLVNSVMRTILSLEAPILWRRTLPFGLSVIGVAQKADGTTTGAPAQTTPVPAPVTR